MTNKQRLDQALAMVGLVSSRSQAEGYIKLGQVKVNGSVAKKSGQMVGANDVLTVEQTVQYVSRAALKLESVAKKLGLHFEGKTVLDVGSSTGGFTDYALKNGAIKVIAVDVGTDQMHPSLVNDPRVELYQKTDIRSIDKLSSPVDIVLIDVSFISLREILPAIKKLIGKSAQVVAMAKPQFETEQKNLNKGVVKNHRLRQDILNNLEQYLKTEFVLKAKADSEVAGANGNVERFYLLYRP